MKMNVDNFIENIIDQIQESQLKLGYAKETIRLYYPLSSLNHLLGSNANNPEEMKQILQKECSEITILGKLKFGIHQERIEISVPPEGCEYVYRQRKVPDFLHDMISLFQKHHCLKIEEICNLFAKYSDKYICKKMPEQADFDYVVYFEEPAIDSYYYCIKMEMGHTIYHRFLKEDYRLLAGEVN